MIHDDQDSIIKNLVATLSPLSTKDQQVLIAGFRPEIAVQVRQTLNQLARDETTIHGEATDSTPLLNGAGPESNAPDAVGAAALLTRIGRYQIRGILGTGGFGTVYLAHDEDLHRFVALKTPHKECMREKDISAFVSEARTLAALDHPNIVSVYDAGQTEDGNCYVVSKYIDGRDLAQLVKQRKITHAWAIGIVSDIASALHHAHQKEVIHRDVKPTNILIGADGSVLLADFGIAMKYGLTQQDAMVSGTPSYMSPEQIQGSTVDGRSDIFSLGVVLYELLTGRKPFNATNYLALCEQIVNLHPRPPRQIDDSIPKQLEA